LGVLLIDSVALSIKDPDQADLLLDSLAVGDADLIRASGQNLLMLGGRLGGGGVS
jgi:hypothetical protein